MPPVGDEAKEQKQPTGDEVKEDEEETRCEVLLEEEGGGEAGLDLCVAEKREALYAARENNLQRQPSRPAETDSETEEHETVLDLLAQSLGLNVSIYVRRGRG